MIHAEIKTDAGVYNIALNAAENLKDAYCIVEDTLKSETPFEGDELLLIGRGAQIKHIRIYSDDAKANECIANDLTAEPYKPTLEKLSETAKNQIEEYEVRLLFLGQKLYVKYLCVATDYKIYFMLNAINEDEPGARLGTDSQIKLAECVVAKSGYEKDKCVIVTPMSMLGDAAEYIGYLYDYVKEDVQEPAQVTSGDATAKAWQGWKEGDKP